MNNNVVKTRAEDLYTFVRKKGVEAISDFISNRKSEELFLDFKRSSDDGKGIKFSDIDRNNLAKAVCGFANSEGGIIVWGVDCSRNADGADVAKSSFLINDVDKFQSWIEASVSGLTIPPVIGVINTKIKVKRNEGYVITYVPKSDYTPHQAIFNKKFYIRAGSNFEDTPYSVLASFFGKRPQPYVFTQFIVGTPEFMDDQIHLQIGVMFRNQGSTIVNDAFINAMVYDFPGNSSQVGFQPLDQNWTGNFSFGRMLTIMSKDGIKIPPESHVQPFTIDMILMPPFKDGIYLKLSCGCEGAPLVRGELKCTKEKLTEKFDEYVKKNKNGELQGKEKHQIFKDLFPNRNISV